MFEVLERESASGEAPPTEDQQRKDMQPEQRDEQKKEQQQPAEPPANVDDQSSGSATPTRDEVDVSALFAWPRGPPHYLANVWAVARCPIQADPLFRRRT